MHSLEFIAVMFVLWQARRGMIRFHRTRSAFDARVKASKLHLLDPGDQMKVFLSDRDLVAPSKAFDEAYQTDDTERDAAKADEIIARALREKTAPPPPPSLGAEVRGFGRRKVG